MFRQIYRFFKTVRYVLQFMRFHYVHQRSRRSIEKWQLHRLIRIVNDLYAHVPLYRDILKSHNIHPSDISTLDNLARLPKTTKQMFTGKPIEYYTRSNARVRGRWGQTSGSSGTPFSPLRRALTHMPLYRDSLHFRFLLHAKPWILSVEWARFVHIRVHPIHRKNHFNIPFDAFLRDPLPGLHMIEKLKPHVIESYPSVLLELARAARLHAGTLRFPYALSFGEQLSPTTRNLVEATFGCELFDRYGLEEFGTVASECKIHNGFHVNSESFIVEITDSQGSPLPTGTRGRVLITDLFNDEMPFVRYDTGDRGHLSLEPCSCGLETPRLWIEGRYAAFLTFGDARYHHFEFDAALDSYMNHIVQYRIEKTSESTARIIIVPSATFSHAQEHVLSAVQAIFGESVSVTLDYADTLPRMPRGKSQIIADTTK